MYTYFTFALHHGENKPSVNMANIGPPKQPTIIKPS